MVILFAVVEVVRNSVFIRCAVEVVRNSVLFAVC